MTATVPEDRDDTPDLVANLARELDEVRGRLSEAEGTNYDLAQLAMILTGERDRARDVAVALEQELAEADRGQIEVEGRGGQVTIGGVILEPDAALDLADRIAEVAAVEGTMLGGMGPDDKGGWTVNMQPSPGLTRRMVAFLCEWLGPAENYTETRADLPFDLPEGTDAMELSPKPAGQVYPYVLTVRRAGGKSPHEKRLEAEAQRDQLAGILGSLWLYVDWRWLTKQLTTPEKEAWASVLEAHWATLDFEHSPADRWWLCPTCGIDIQRGANDGPHEGCCYATETNG